MIAPLVDEVADSAKLTCRALQVAINRTKAWMDSHDKASPYLLGLVGKDVDFTTLSADIQCAIFLCDKNADKGAHFVDIVNAIDTPNWAKVSESNWYLFSWPCIYLTKHDGDNIHRRTGHYKGQKAHAWTGGGADALLRVPTIFLAWRPPL